MTWHWTDELAKVLIEHDAVDPRRVAEWISAPSAYRSDLSAKELARKLLAEIPSRDDAAAPSAA